MDGGIIMVKTNTTNLVTNTATTLCNTSIAVVRGGGHINEGVVVANGKEYGLTGGYSIRAFVGGIPMGKEFLCSTVGTFAPRSAVRFFRSGKLGAGAREKGHIFPTSSGSISIISAVRSCTIRSNYGVIYSATGTLVLRSNTIVNIGYRRGACCTSDVVVYYNNGDCPLANSANSNCALTGRTKRAVIPLGPSLIPFASNSGRYGSVRKLTLGGITLEVISGGDGGAICDSFNRVLFARFKVDNPVVLSTDSRVHSVRPSHCVTRVSLGPTLSFRRLSEHVRGSFGRGSGHSISGTFSGLLPEGVVIPILGH